MSITAPASVRHRRARRRAACTAGETLITGVTPAPNHVYTKLGLRFEWDAKKAAENVRKHGVRFQDAVTAFDDPFALVRFDDEHSDLEDREIVIGRSDRGVLVVVFTDPKPGVRRLISARKPTRNERRQYEAR